MLVLVHVAVAATVYHERPLVMNCCVVASANAGSHDLVTVLVPVSVLVQAPVQVVVILFSSAQLLVSVVLQLLIIVICLLPYVPEQTLVVLVWC